MRSRPRSWPGPSAAGTPGCGDLGYLPLPLAAVLNLVGAFLSTEVAKTISGGIIKEGPGGVQITPELIFAGWISFSIRDRIRGRRESSA